MAKNVLKNSKQIVKILFIVYDKRVFSKISIKNQKNIIFGTKYNKTTNFALYINQLTENKFSVN
jgi:hypothetical protein